MFTTQVGLVSRPISRSFLFYAQYMYTGRKADKSPGPAKLKIKNRQCWVWIAD
jgi:hypothetical protein